MKINWGSLSAAAGLLVMAGGAVVWGAQKNTEIDQNTIYRLSAEIGQRIQWAQTVASKYGCSYDDKCPKMAPGDKLTVEQWKQDIRIKQKELEEKAAKK